jgi:hypothetical protein
MARHTNAMMSRGMIAGAVVLLWPVFVLAQSPGPTQQQLDKAIRFGAIATIGPLCGLRDTQWGTDLRRSALQAMGAQAMGEKPDPARQKLADQAGAALSYAEDEALEDFADAAPEATCQPLAHNPDLIQADRMVAAFRAGSGQTMW